MTEVEFTLSAFMIDSPQNKSTGGLETIGSEYKALRAMRYDFSPRLPIHQ
jgi:hypothetical protein